VASRVGVSLDTASSSAILGGPQQSTTPKLSTEVRGSGGVGAGAGGRSHRVYGVAEQGDQARRPRLAALANAVPARDPRWLFRGLPQGPVGRLPEGWAPPSGARLGEFTAHKSGRGAT
jgi:hypothetical protein